jgi:hypothetical protein
MIYQDYLSIALLIAALYVALHMIPGGGSHVWRH